MTTFKTIHLFDTEDGVQEVEHEFEFFQEAADKADELRAADVYCVANVYLVEGSTPLWGTHTEHEVLLSY